MVKYGQIKTAADRYEAGVASISQLNGNVDGPKSSRRYLVLSAMNAFLLYGANLWGDHLARRIIVGALRKYSDGFMWCLPITSAVTVIAGVIPLPSTLRNIMTIGKIQGENEWRLL